MQITRLLTLPLSTYIDSILSNNFYLKVSLRMTEILHHSKAALCMWLR